MKRVFLAALLALSLLAAPAFGVAAHASGPQPYCTQGGNLCVTTYTAKYTDNNDVTIVATWGVDKNSGDIEDASATITLPAGARDCHYTVNPPTPNSGPMDLVSYDYTLTNGSTSSIGLYVYNSGASYPYSNYNIPTSCPS